MAKGLKDESRILFWNSFLLSSSSERSVTTSSGKPRGLSALISMSYHTGPRAEKTSARVGISGALSLISWKVDSSIFISRPKTLLRELSWETTRTLSLVTLTSSSTPSAPSSRALRKEGIVFSLSLKGDPLCPRTRTLSHCFCLISSQESTDLLLP